MEKKIEDYMYLYLRCPERIVKCIKSNYYFVHEMYIHNDDEFVLMPHLLAAFLLHGKGCDWKLILRPLSDMTEKEAKEGWRFVTDNHYNGVTNPKHAFIYGNLSISTEEWANITRYLLSKGFDLFGLIGAGLALDKTKLTAHA